MADDDTLYCYFQRTMDGTWIVPSRTSDYSLAGKQTSQGSQSIGTIDMSSISHSIPRALRYTRLPGFLHAGPLASRNDCTNETGIFRSFSPRKGWTGPAALSLPAILPLMLP